MEVLHLGLAVIMDDYNAISETTLRLRFPDGIEREAYLMWSAWIADQQEYDKLCCETSQRCKQCDAPKNRPRHRAGAGGDGDRHQAWVPALDRWHMPKSLATTACPTASAPA